MQISCPSLLIAVPMPGVGVPPLTPAARPHTRSECSSVVSRIDDVGEVAVDLHRMADQRQPHERRLERGIERARRNARRGHTVDRPATCGGRIRPTSIAPATLNG